jgi:imidazolonepropionase
VTLRVLSGGAEAAAPGLLIRGASEVVTMAGGLRMGAAQDDVSAMGGDGAADPTGRHAPAVAAWQGRILAVGRLPEVMQRVRGLGLDEKRFTVLDARGGTVTPGLIDPHTHLLFAGTREGELRLRQQGAGYLEILAAGGGILSTVQRTRAATAEALHAHGRRWLDEMLGHGVTTIEAKSGYGLDTPTELRLLEVAGQLGAEGPIEVVPTYLGAHAVPPEYRGRRAGAEAYAASVIGEQLPAVERQGVAVFCDVFCERGVFSVEQSRRILEAGRRHGLAPRLHADELVPSGGAQLAAEVGAVSADHLAAPSREGIAALVAAAEAGQPVVATLLPATSLVLMKEHEAPARVLVDRGAPVALGSDFNPGTSPTPNLQLVLSLAVLRLKLTPSEALAAVTINAAHAVGLGETHGALEEGRVADLVIWDVPSHELLPYWLGADLARVVVKRGSVALARG